MQSHPHPNTDFVILIDSHDLLLDDLPYIFEGLRIGSFIHDLVFRIEFELVILLLVLPILLIFIIVTIISVFDRLPPAFLVTLRHYHFPLRLNQG